MSLYSPSFPLVTTKYLAIICFLLHPPDDSARIKSMSVSPRKAIMGKESPSSSTTVTGEHLSQEVWGRGEGTKQERD